MRAEQVMRESALIVGERQCLEDNHLCLIITSSIWILAAPQNGTLSLTQESIHHENKHISLLSMTHCLSTSTTNLNTVKFFSCAPCLTLPRFLLLTVLSRIKRLPSVEEVEWSRTLLFSQSRPRLYDTVSVEPSCPAVSSYHKVRDFKWFNYWLLKQSNYPNQIIKVVMSWSK